MMTQAFPLNGWPVTLAQWLGSHTVPVYLGLVAGVVVLSLVAALCWRSLPAAARSRLKIGYACLATVGFAVIAYQVMAYKSLPKFDALVAFYISVDARFAYLDLAAKVSYLAQSMVMAAIGVLIGGLLWLKRYRTEAVVYVLSIAGNGVLNTAIKLMAQRARPTYMALP